MSFAQIDSGLSLDQAPPLRIPVAFFAAAPLWLLAAAAMLLVLGDAAWTSRWNPETLALTHVLTLGFLGNVMLGALYQMTPVVAGERIRGVKSAYLVHLFLNLGLAFLSLSLLRIVPGSPFAGFASAGIGLAIFVASAGPALLKSSGKTETIRGMRIAMLGLLLVLCLGLALAFGRDYGAFALRVPLLNAHLFLALFVWVGGLLLSVSFQVVPMFYLATELTAGAQRLLRILLLAGFLVPLAVLLVALVPSLENHSGLVLSLCSVPTLFGVLLLHPYLLLRSIRQRRRRRKDPSLRFWWLGLIAAPPSLAVAILSYFSAGQALPLLTVWLLLVAWSGMIVHGMLTRILPFLYWFHAYSRHVGLEEVPSMREMLPDEVPSIGIALHAAVVVLGGLAILSGRDDLSRLTGIALLLLATSLLTMLGLLRKHSPGRVEARRLEAASRASGDQAVPSD